MSSTAVACRLTILVEGSLSLDGRYVRPGGITSPSELPLFDALGAGERVRVGTIRRVRLEDGSWLGDAHLPAEFVGRALGADLGFSSWAGEAEEDGDLAEVAVIESGRLVGCSVVDDPAFPACRIEAAP